MVRKTGEQFSVRLLRAQRGTIVQKSVLSVPISAGLNESDGDVRFHFQGHSSQVGCFLAGKGVFFGSIERVKRHMVLKKSELYSPLRSSCMNFSEAWMPVNTRTTSSSCFSSSTSPRSRPVSPMSQSRSSVAQDLKTSLRSRVSPTSATRST